jgi:predicted nucleic acid-binding protein
MENRNPFEILTPYERWVPTREQMELFQDKYEQLLPPLVHKIREAVYKWRDDNYEGASRTTKSLFNFWFNTEHKEFQFYFSQREAIESIVYLYEIAEAKDKYELMRFDSSERISTGMFQETWTRYVIKMATNDVEEIIDMITILPFDIKASREAAKITAELKKSGQQIGIADELIAAICKTYDICLLTKNIGHFQRVRDLKVIGLNEI